MRKTVGSTAQSEETARAKALRYKWIYKQLEGPQGGLGFRCGGSEGGQEKSEVKLEK